MLPKELTLEDILKVLALQNVKDFVKPLGGGLYKVGDNLICNEKLLSEIDDEIFKTLFKQKM